MKMTKRVLAIVIAALMLAAMIPFAVSAATPETYTMNVTSSKEGFAFDIYKIADTIVESGTYSTAAGYSSADDAVLAALKDGDAQAVLAACNADGWTAKKDAVATYTVNDSKTAAVKTVSGLTPGVYFVKCTQKPAEVTTIVNRVIPLPYFENGAWAPADGVYAETIDFASKIDVKPTVDKKIVDNGNEVEYVTRAIGKPVDFKLTTTVTGSLNKKLAVYNVTDSYEEALTFDKSTVKVALASDNKTKTVDAANYDVTEGTNSFKVEFKSAYLAQDEFYGYSKVVVTYTATLNEKAKDSVKYGVNGVKNTDGLEYGNKPASESAPTVIPGPTVYVFTAKINVIKVDANDHDKKLAGAEFTLFDADKKPMKDATGKNIVLVTDGNGFITYQGLDKGTYFVQETKEPDGYNRNTAFHQVDLVPTINKVTDSSVAVQGYKYTMTLPAGDAATVTVENTKTPLPPTGGVGTMMFFVIGGSLIAAAGVLLVVVLKKRAK